MDEKNIDVKFSDGVLTIKGEKEEVKEEKKKDYYLSERSFGSFQRAFQVPDGVDADKIEANFKKGVLTVTMPKSAEAQKSAKKIDGQGGLNAAHCMIQSGLRLPAQSGLYLPEPCAEVSTADRFRSASVSHLTCSRTRFRASRG